jgi:hypothetical protein
MKPDHLATCHCIISHPSKPKFLVIEHSTGWFPPIVKFPADRFVGSMATIIADGIMNKYGLKVTVLRHIFESVDYHCIELETQSEKSTKKLNAVWVGEEDYSQYRGNEAGQPDPFADWLAAAESRRIPRQRPHWERRGWFGQAAAWIDHELDRRSIQVTGSVKQLKACWYASAVLRVETSLGQHYFKASYPAPPNEARLTVALAKRWPKMIQQPLAFDSDKNWLLMNDYSRDGGGALQVNDYSSLARRWADLQIESIDDREDWAALGCESRTLGYLSGFLENITHLAPILQSGPGGLSDEEMSRLNPIVDSFRGICSQLAEYSLPATLVHPDFRTVNVMTRDGGFRIIDWSDTVIAHPFFSIHELTRSIGSGKTSQQAPGNGPTRENLLEQIRNDYLEPFAAFESPKRLKEAYELSSRLMDAWKLFLRSARMAYFEPGGVASQVMQRVMQRHCKSLLQQHSSNGGTIH